MASIKRHNNRATRKALYAFFTKTSVINGNRPIPTALFTLGADGAGWGALAPTPALPKDQPLRGRRHNDTFVLLYFA